MFIVEGSFPQQSNDNNVKVSCVGGKIDRKQLCEKRFFYIPPIMTRAAVRLNGAKKGEKMADNSIKKRLEKKFRGAGFHIPEFL